jgi:hypothetical protein
MIGGAAARRSHGSLGAPAGLLPSRLLWPAAKNFAVSSGDQVVRFGDVMADSQTRTLAYLVTFTCQDGTPGCTLVRF